LFFNAFGMLIIAKADEKYSKKGIQRPLFCKETVGLTEFHLFFINKFMCYKLNLRMCSKNHYIYGLD
jgi:hypothetical protein